MEELRNAITISEKITAQALNHIINPTDYAPVTPEVVKDIATEVIDNE